MGIVLLHDVAARKAKGIEHAPQLPGTAIDCIKQFPRRNTATRQLIKKPIKNGGTSDFRACE